MKTLSNEIMHFFKEQGFGIVSTLDGKGGIHCSAKGIIDLKEEGRVYLIDIYRARTFQNLQQNPTISVTAIDEQQFIGYTLKGKAAIVDRNKIKDALLKQWEDNVIQRLSRRVITNIQKDKKSAHHPEARFPSPQYLIEMEVEDIIDLAPRHLKSL